MSMSDDVTRLDIVEFSQDVYTDNELSNGREHCRDIIDNI